MSAQELRTFSEQVHRRSKEHAAGIKLLAEAGLLAPAVSILRQEVDSLIRVIYLLAQPPQRQLDLVRASIDGQKWKNPNGRGRVTDREMTNLSTQLIGWIQDVYRFGCAFIHLSNYHNYNTADPLSLLPEAERHHIIQYLREYHRGPASDRPTVEELLPLLPQVLQKISDNLQRYLTRLGSGQHFKPEDI